jgi:Rrf2 family protein
MLTKKAKYALKALQSMGRTGHPMLIAEISAKENIPRKFLELILLELKRDGLLVSKSGRGGGYNLRERPSSISIGRVVRLIDGPLAQIPCVSLTAYRKCHECEDEKTCSIRLIMKQVRDATAEILDRTTLEDLMKTKKTGRQRMNHPLNSSFSRSRRFR